MGRIIELNNDAMKLRQLILNDLKRNKNIVDAIGLYVVFENTLHDTYKNLTLSQCENADMLISYAVQIYNAFDAKLTKKLYEGFDLCSLVESATSKVLEQYEQISTEKKLYHDIVANCIAAVFQMWYDGIKYKDICNYFENREHRGLPCTNDRTQVYAWAIDHGIQCSDTDSFSKFLDVLKGEATEDEENRMQELKNLISASFDNSIDLFVKYGMDEDFLLCHRDLCRDTYIAIMMWFFAQPPALDFNVIFDDTDEAMDRELDLFDDFMSSYDNPELNDLIIFDEFEFLEQHPDEKRYSKLYRETEDKADEASGNIDNLFMETISICLELENNNIMSRKSLYNQAIRSSSKS